MKNQNEMIITLLEMLSSNLSLFMAVGYDGSDLKTRYSSDSHKIGLNDRVTDTEIENPN